MENNALIRRTNAYKVVENDKKNGLFHAYLLLSKDEKYLKEDMKAFAKLIMCQNGGCGECRVCRLIDRENHADVKFLPENGDKILTEDINALIEESYVKPLEEDKKLFLIVGAEKMPAVAQNKLLITLEEPPKYVIILIGATNEYALLPTVRSRVKTLAVPLYTDEELIGALKEKCPDENKLRLAVSCGDGTLGRAEDLYGDTKLENLFDFVADVIVNMNSSRDVLEYSGKLAKMRDHLADVFNIASLYFRDMLAEAQGARADNAVALAKVRGAVGFNTGALVYALDKTAEAVKRAAYNANETMLIEWWLFAILEGKHIWQRS